MELLLFIWLFFGIICWKMAETRNRSPLAGFVAGGLFGLLAVIYYLMAGKKA